MVLGFCLIVIKNYKMKEKKTSATYYNPSEAIKGSVISLIPGNTNSNNACLCKGLHDLNENCYPQCDSTVWLRSCLQEVEESITGITTGDIPKWIRGSLLRNGPGSLKVGPMEFQHLFDSSALLHRFGIFNGTVSYQCKFVQTNTLKRNLIAQRIVNSEFGTKCAPDPCHSIFHKFFSIFNHTEESDNAMISIYPFKDEYYAFTETPIIHRINPFTLETEGTVYLPEYVGIISHTSHPHVTEDGTVFNVGLGISKSGPVYHIICFPCGERMFLNAYIVATIPCRWKLHPGYMHSFGMSKNYFMIIEQPLSISILNRIKVQIYSEPLASCLKWFDNECTYFYLVDRFTGKLVATYKTEAFFYLHVINQFERENEVVIDICCYRDPNMLNCMYIESMKNMQNDPDYAASFRGRPLRFVLPTGSLRCGEKYEENSVSSGNPAIGSKDTFDRMSSKSSLASNNSGIKFFKHSDGSVYIRPELLCDLGCETPRINYANYMGTKYRFFYAISSDVDANNPGTLIKVDTEEKTCRVWNEVGCYPSEPIFVARPNSVGEDDGVVLSAIVWGNQNANKVGLLVLCARQWIELGRCVFQTPGPVPKCLHGWFSMQQQ